MPTLNIANSIFTGWNDRQGIMLCGYEWGWSKKDQTRSAERARLINEPYNDEVECTFSNKALRYGEKA